MEKGRGDADRVSDTRTNGSERARTNNGTAMMGAIATAVKLEALKALTDTRKIAGMTGVDRFAPNGGKQHVEIYRLEINAERALTMFLGNPPTLSTLPRPQANH